MYCGSFKILSSNTFEIIYLVRTQKVPFMTPPCKHGVIFDPPFCEN